MTIKNLLDNSDRRYILCGGKGGVGKTSISASIGLAFANNNQKTLIISTDPAHSLSDSLDQDVSGGEIIKIEGVENLYCLEIDPKESTSDLKDIAGLQKDEKIVSDLMSSMNSMGMGFDEFGDLLNTLPPGVDEAMALAKVVQIIEKEEYQDFQRIIFDTAPTGHTLRMLSLPDFLDGFMGKIIKLRVKMSNIGSAFKGLFGMQAQKDNSLEIMERIKENIVKVKDLFRNEKSTEFIIITIPTMMAANESGRLAEALKQEHINVKEVIINQIMPENSDCKFCSIRAKGQEENLEFLRQLFNPYNITEVPFFDHEIRGIEGLALMSKHILDLE